ncbi:hypothetical protein TNIN_351991 [Trichonephila inaurata madagascariensis]|uniref:Uncharacterized protein n=1 Tax=Trichonephila inaurata madagascariensis TaxID=2747483 RepID=A0A8X6XPU2_9ARAC|nr:hypothetical protein TNIN_351991 [Trichonephila inaurata madagascariensis]
MASRALLKQSNNSSSERDISKLDLNDNAEACIPSKHFTNYLPQVIEKSALDGEVEASRDPPQHLNVPPSGFERNVIFSDSQATILAAANC